MNSVAFTFKDVRMVVSTNGKPATESGKNAQSAAAQP
jgi:hypothetical protein